MKKLFRKDMNENRADYLRGVRSRNTRVPEKPAEFPQVMPPLPVIAIEDEDRSSNLPDALFKRPTSTIANNRPGMMNLVYPPIRGAVAHPETPSIPAGPHEPIQPTDMFRKLTGRVRQPLKPESIPMKTAADQPSAVYLTPRQVVSRPAKSRPNLRELHIGWRVLSFILAGALSYLVFFMWTSPVFKMQTPTVSGNVRVGSEEFLKNMAVEGKPSFLLVPEQLNATLLNTFPEVISADLQFKFPNKLNLKVVEREPVLIWKQGGQTYWIDLFGIPMMPRGQAGNWYVVTAAGNTAGPVPLDPVNHPGLYQPVADPGLILMILNLGNLTPAGTSIAYDPRFGLGWNDPDGWKVFFGFNTDYLESKLAQYAGIVNNLKAQGIKPAIVSVQYPYAPFYRLEQ